uniref:Uncharacterized protein n=1 Tax=Rhizophora mucronata TaxID=61149 RepID=A0A2P2NQR7_RHIMU
MQNFIGTNANDVKAGIQKHKSLCV